MRPFIAGMIGGACGAAFASIMNVYATANGVTGLFGLLITTDTIGGYILTMLVAFGVAFAISWIMGIKEDEPASNETAETDGHNDTLPEVSDNEILSPSQAKPLHLKMFPTQHLPREYLDLAQRSSPPREK